MFEKEEEQLTTYKTMFDHIDIPVNALDEAIFSGFQRVKFEDKRKRHRRKWFVSVIAAAVVLVGFFTSIRLSPAFADYMTTIPGMEKIVELIRLDKGQVAAIENDYYEKIGATDEKNGLKFTIDGAIADENGLVFFYTMKSEKEQEGLMIEKAELKSLDGEDLSSYSSGFGSPGKLEKEKYVYNGTMEYFFDNPIKSKKFELKLSVKGIAIKEPYSFQFELQKEKKLKKTYELNKTVTIEGQKIHFIDASIYPLRVAVHVKMDLANTKRILNFDDLRLVDENGETWNKISNGVVTRNISANETIIYLQSNYFREPKELYLVMNKIQAVDKDEVNVIVDSEKGQILKQPKGNIISGFRVEGNDLVFSMKTKKRFPYFLFSNITDGNGKGITSPSSYDHSTKDSGESIQGVNIPDLKKQTNPISLELSFFPSWIKGHEKIKIK